MSCVKNVLFLSMVSLKVLTVSGTLSCISSKNMIEEKMDGALARFSLPNLLDGFSKKV